MKKVILSLFVALVLATSFVVVKAGGREYGHPILVWNEDKTYLMDVLYQPSVGYQYAEIEAAFYTFATQVCGGEGEPKCWHGQHVGILKNLVSTPPEVTGFYKAPDGYWYLVDTGECLIKDGCLEK